MDEVSTASDFNPKRQKISRATGPSEWVAALTAPSAGFLMQKMHMEAAHAAWD